jgi:DNA-binding transcriptional MerR regulator
MNAEVSHVMTIGRVASAAGVTADTIRYYERRGLLPRAVRTASGYRLYAPGIVHRLKVVRSAQRFGFSLAEIATFLGVRDRGGMPCRDVRAAGQRLLEAIDRQIAELRATRKDLRSTLMTWDQLLERTPPHRPAHLLETLPVPTSPAVKPPIRSRGTAL